MESGNQGSPHDDHCSYDSSFPSDSATLLSDKEKLLMTLNYRIGMKEEKEKTCSMDCTVTSPGLNRVQQDEVEFPINALKHFQEFVPKDSELSKYHPRWEEDKSAIDILNAGGGYPIQEDNVDLHQIQPSLIQPSFLPREGIHPEQSHILERTSDLISQQQQQPQPGPITPNSYNNPPSNLRPKLWNSKSNQHRFPPPYQRPGRSSSSLGKLGPEVLERALRDLGGHAELLDIVNHVERNEPRFLEMAGTRRKLRYSIAGIMSAHAYSGRFEKKAKVENGKRKYEWHLIQRRIPMSLRLPQEPRSNFVPIGPHGIPRYPSNDFLPQTPGWGECGDLLLLSDAATSSGADMDISPQSTPVNGEGAPNGEEEPMDAGETTETRENNLAA